MTAGIIGAAFLAAGTVMAALLARTTLDVATVMVAGFAAWFAAVTGMALLCLSAAGRQDAAAACDDDGTGNCAGCTVIGDDIARDGTPVTVTDAEIEQWVSKWNGGDGA